MVLRAGASAPRLVFGELNQITGTKGNDWFHAFAEGDLSRTGNVVSLGRGDDRLYASATANDACHAISEAFGGLGNDRLDFFTESRADAFTAGYGGPGNDILTFTQTCVETAGTNGGHFEGGLGNDHLNLNMLGNGTFDFQFIDALGNAGDDRIKSILFGEDARNSLDGGFGNDHLRGILGGSGDQFLYGRTGADVLRGEVWQEGRTLLFGGSGNDRMQVVGGDLNELNGAKGEDVLIAGNGSDIFRFRMNGITPDGRDVVIGFDHEHDQISLHGWDGSARVNDNGTDVRVSFDNGGVILFRGVGDGTVDSIYDLVDDPGQITDAWF